MIKLSNSNIIGVASTGAKKFETGLRGLIDMPAEFQKSMDIIHAPITTTYCFVDNIIMLTIWSKWDYLSDWYLFLE